MPRLVWTIGAAALGALVAVMALAPGYGDAATETHGYQVRIVAQRHADGRVEFALQQRDGSRWGERILPERRFFPATGSGRWLHSSTITLEVTVPDAPTALTATPTATATAAALTVAPESCSGYDRSAFGSYPDVRSGSSFYLGRSITPSNRSQFHTDHVVALREACESGLPRSRWREFGSYAQNLVPALGRLNSSKGDSDPAEWTNPHQYGRISAERWCAYIQRHVAVKQHFGLTADQAELDAINRSGCATATQGSPPTPTPTATPSRSQTYSSCAAVPSSVPRIQGCSRGTCPGGGRGYPASLVPSARDGDSDGVVCER
ncbi:MAG: hypothetical protein F4056_00880 [Chloroflexi bacterium]|nr:hypothetical protein [Chloroflexota bacterium]